MEFERVDVLTAEGRERQIERHGAAMDSAGEIDRILDLADALSMIERDGRGCASADVHRVSDTVALFLAASVASGIRRLPVRSTWEGRSEDAIVVIDVPAGQNKIVVYCSTVTQKFYGELRSVIEARRGIEAK